MEVEAKVQDLEKIYSANPSDLTSEAWQVAQVAYQQLLSSSAEKRFFAKQTCEEGEKTSVFWYGLQTLTNCYRSH